MAAILHDAARGDEDAWRWIVEQYGRRVFAMVRSRCGRADLAEEITQSVFVTIASTLGRGGYAEQGRFESWLFRVAMNRTRDELRRSRVQAAAVEPARFDNRVSPDAAASNDTELDRLRAAMRELPEADRELIELRHHGQLSFRQLADLLNEPIGTLLARHHRALRKLRQSMGARADTTGTEP